MGEHRARYTEGKDPEGAGFPKKKSKEEFVMALKHLFGWSHRTEAASACGAGDKQ